jgi:hypothetical protein
MASYATGMVNWRGVSPSNTVMLWLIGDELAGVRTHYDQVPMHLLQQQWKNPELIFWNDNKLNSWQLAFVVKLREQRSIFLIALKLQL